MINVSVVHRAEITFDHIRIKRINAHILTPKESFHNNNYVLDYCACKFQELIVNILNTKRNLLYIRNPFVPRSKHFPPWL